MRAVVHIGLHKTGTTSIQAACCKFRNRLYEQGFNYPAAHIKWSGHHHLAWSLGVNHPHADPSLRLETLLEDYLETGTHHSLLLSSEDFEFAPAPGVARFLNLLRARCDRIQVICYLRHPAEYIESDYKQNVKMESSRFGGTLLDFVKKIHVDKRVDYFGIVNRWDVEGAEIVLRNYDRDCLVGGDVVSDFFSTVGIHGLTAPPQRNVSQRNVTARMQAIGNTHGVHSPDFWQAVDSNVRAATRKDVSLLDENIYALIMDAARPSIERLLATYPVPEGDRLLQDRRKPGELDPDAAMDIAASALLESIPGAKGKLAGAPLQTARQTVSQDIPMDTASVSQRQIIAKTMHRAGIPVRDDSVYDQLQRVSILIPNPGYGRIQYALPDDYAYEHVRALFERNDGAIRSFYQSISAVYNDPFPEIADTRQDETTPFWRNNFFGRGDAGVLMSILATCHPRLMVEVGVGNSTKFARYAIQRFGLGTRIESIDPSPRANINGITDLHIRQSVLEVDLSHFDKLQAGDILFLDGSHVALPGTDVPHYMLNILPRLNSGVMVHIHDIFLPWEYPRAFRDRQFNEQHLLASMLLFSEGWDILMPVYYAGKLRILPHVGGSIWLRRR